MYQQPPTSARSAERALDTAPATDIPDLSSYRAVHAAFRSSTAALVDGLRCAPPGDRRRAAALRRWFDGLSGELDLHHHLEDDLFFASLAERLPSYVQYEDDVSTDHDRIDELVTTVRMLLATMAAGNAGTTTRHETIRAAEDLDTTLTDHLDFEDADILPLFERHYTAEEYRELDQRAIRSASLRQALFTVPWLIATAPADVSERMLTEAPLALRIVHRLTRRRYARLTRSALGPAASMLVGSGS